MRTTSIKETLEKHSQKSIEKESNAIESSEIQKDNLSTTESNTVEFSKECWDECVQNSCKLSKIAEILLLKVNPSPTDDYKIEFEVASEIEKNEIKQVQILLLQKLHEKTGNHYSIEMQVIKPIREKTVDKTNPDEKFIHLCQENPYLMEFKQRLNLAVS